MTHVFHISDIHIKQDNHKKIIFAANKLAGYIKTITLPGDVCKIVITGDIFEFKTSYSQYDILVFRELLSILSAHEIIVIPGDHDMQTGSSTNLIESLPGLPIKLYANNSVINISGVNVMLHYGKSDAIPDFTEGVIMMGGEHDSQIFTPPRGINVLSGYAGSLVQINRFESLYHGGLHWKLNVSGVTDVNKFSLPILDAEITIKANPSGVIYPDLSTCNNIKYIELVYTETNKISNIEVFKKIKNDVVIKMGRIDNVIFMTPGYNPEISRDAVTFLGLPPGGMEFSRDEVIELHNTLMAKFDSKTQVEYSQWKLDYLQWSGILCYGPDNYIDFTSLRGQLSSIMGVNQSGKSTIIDIILFVLYDYNLRGDNKNIINNQTREYNIFLFISVVNKKYAILRSGNSTDSKTTHTTYIFAKDTSRGNSFEQLPYKNKEVFKFIENTIGPREQLIDLNIAEQHRSMKITPDSLLMNLRSTLKLDIYASIEEHVREDIRNINHEINSKTKTVEALKLAQNISPEVLADLKKQLELEKSRDAEFANEIQRLRDQNIKLTATMHPVPNVNDLHTKITQLYHKIIKAKKPMESPPTLSVVQQDNNLYKIEPDASINYVAEINRQINEYKRKISELSRSNNPEIQTEINAAKKQLLEFIPESRIQGLEINFNEEAHKQIIESESLVSRELAEVIMQLRRTGMATPGSVVNIVTGTLTPEKMAKLKTLLSKITALLTKESTSRRKYNPDCECCNHNKLLDSSDPGIDKIINEIGEFRLLLDRAVLENKRQIAAIKTYTSLVKSAPGVAATQTQISELQNRIVLLESHVNDVNRYTSLFNDFSDSLDKIAANANSGELISKNNFEIAKINKLRDALKIPELSRQIDSLTTVAQLKVELETLDYRKRLYKTYLGLIDTKTGAPFKLFRSYGDEIQQNINYMLKQLAGFTINFIYEPKFDITLDNIGSNTPAVSIHQISGAQRFILDMCLRLYMINFHPYVSRFVIIDEGFGMIDPPGLLQLRNFLINVPRIINIDFMMIINNVDSLQSIDMIQLAINATPGGFSKLQFGKPNPDIDKIMKIPLKTITPGSDAKHHCDVCNKDIKDFKRHEATDTHKRKVASQSCRDVSRAALSNKKV